MGEDDNLAKADKKPIIKEITRLIEESRFRYPIIKIRQIKKINIKGLIPFFTRCMTRPFVF